MISSKDVLSYDSHVKYYDCFKNLREWMFPNFHWGFDAQHPVDSWRTKMFLK